MKSKRGGYCGAVEVKTLLDNTAGEDAILRAIDSAVRRTKPGDVLVFGFAGHGVRGKDGKYYLTPLGFTTDNIEGSGLPWSKVAESISRANARTIVFLDACHSGLADSQGIATNDDAVG